LPGESFTIGGIFVPAGGILSALAAISGRQIDDRALLEIRVSEMNGSWILHRRAKSARALAEKFKHPVGRWYHVALVFDGLTCVIT
jgi:hypothetical protein